MSLTGFFSTSRSIRLRRSNVVARGAVAGWLCSFVVLVSAIGCGGNVSSMRTASYLPPARPASPPTTGRLPADKYLAPSNHRNWIASQVVLPHATVHGDEAKIHNIRNCDYVTENDYVVQYYDKTYNLNELESVDFIVVPFRRAAELAHTMLSFGFGKGRYLVSSVEARLEKGESYSPLVGSARQFELMYVLADERDVIRLRTEVRDSDVYIYRSVATPAQARALLTDILQRVNTLTKEPEFYDTLTNNCTSNIVRHVNHLFPGTVPTDYRVLLPGFSPQLAYEVGLLDKTVPFEELQRRARVNDLAHRYKDSTDFSEKIRR